MRVTFIFEFRILRTAIINKQCAKRTLQRFWHNDQKNGQSYYHIQLMSSIDLALFYPLNSQAARVARETDDVAVVALGPETKSVFKKEKLETKHASVCALRESECRNTPLLPLPFFTASRIRVRGENFHSPEYRSVFILEPSKCVFKDTGRL